MILLKPKSADVGSVEGVAFVNKLAKRVKLRIIRYSIFRPIKPSYVIQGFDGLLLFLIHEQKSRRFWYYQEIKESSECAEIEHYFENSVLIVVKI